MKAHQPITPPHNVYYLNKKSGCQARLHDNLYRDLSYVTRADDQTKYISLKAEKLLANLAGMITRNRNKKEFVDHQFLSQINRVKSSAQNANILKQLADIIDYEYHNCITFQGNRRTYGYVIKFTKDGEQRITNPELFYSFNSCFKPEIKCDTKRNKLAVESKKISTPTIYKKEYTEEEIEDSSYRAISSISKDNVNARTNARAREENQSPKSKQLEDLLCYPEGAASLPDCSTEKHKDETMKAYDWEDPARKLDLAISKNFDTQMATKLTTSIEYIHNKSKNVMCLRYKEKFELSNEQSEKLKQLIRNIYGQATKFCRKGTEEEKQEWLANQAKISNPHHLNATENFQKIITNLELAHDPKRIKAWFKNVKFIETEKSIIFDTSDSAVDYITNNFTSTLKQSSKELGMPLQFIGRSKVQIGKVYNIEITEDGKYNINHQLAE